MAGGQFNALAATGIVSVRVGDHTGWTGSCFAFRQPHIALTAAHCVPEADEVWLHYPGRDQRRRSVRIERHPDADVAIVFTEPDLDDDGEGYHPSTFWNHVGNWSMGEEFYAYGFPTEGGFAEANVPTPRLFTGNYQRFLRWTTPGSESKGYLAGEMSVPAPGGLSGGPVFRHGAPQMLTGLVTSNLETYSVLHSIDEVQADGVQYREESRRVIQYGLAAMLSELAEWLDEFVEHRVGTAHRRKD